MRNAIVGLEILFLSATAQSSIISNTSLAGNKTSLECLSNGAGYKAAYTGTPANGASGSLRFILSMVAFQGDGMRQTNYFATRSGTWLTNEWGLALEDLACARGGQGFNDFRVMIELVVPVAIPAFLELPGTEGHLAAVMVPGDPSAPGLNPWLAHFLLTSFLCLTAKRSRSLSCLTFQNSWILTLCQVNY